MLRWLPFLVSLAIFSSNAAFAQAAGTLVSAARMTNAPQGAAAWRVVYISRSDRGAPERVSGVVIAPAGQAGQANRPVLAWAHGTSGIEDKCAPSVSPNLFESIPGLDEAIARGYVVVATDYAGLGTPGTHPYLIGGSAARSVLDAIRAVRAIKAARAGRRFAVWGESQGGHAALFTGFEANAYAPDLQLAGVVAAAPPTDLVANLTGGTDPSIRAFLTAFTTHSWSRYFGYSMASLGKPATARLIDRLAQNNCVTLEAKPKLGMMIGVATLRQQLKGVDLGRIEPWARTARANSAPIRPLGAPLMIVQSTGDVIVSPEVTRNYAQRLCRKGQRLRYLTLPGSKHEYSARDSTTDTLDWIDARFSGQPAPNDCGRI